MLWLSTVANIKLTGTERVSFIERMMRMELEQLWLMRVHCESKNNDVIRS